MSWDHPRVCGEHPKREFMTRLLTGSSPRMRGTRSVGRTVCLGLGIIPAYAGNTSRRPVLTISSRDHPRVCGEHYGRNHWHHRREGSSPRMRGTPLALLENLFRSGIIPAYAGNTALPRCRGMHCRDHPRVCGEHLRFRMAQNRHRGSSPRMRRTQRP